MLFSPLPGISQVCISSFVSLPVSPATHLISHTPTSRHTYIDPLLPSSIIQSPSDVTMNLLRPHLIVITRIFIPTLAQHLAPIHLFATLSQQRLPQPPLAPHHRQPGRLAIPAAWNIRAARRPQHQHGLLEDRLIKQAYYVIGVKTGQTQVQATLLLTRHAVRLSYGDSATFLLARWNMASNCQLTTTCRAETAQPLDTNARS